MLYTIRREIAKLIVSRLKRKPLHVAIIPDGNRRWARRRHLPVWVGHLKGYEKLRRILNFLWNVGIRYVTVYVLSRENCLHRSREELKKLHELLLKGVDDLLSDERVRSGLVRFRVIGDLSLLPDHIVLRLKEVEEITRRNHPHVLTACICYSGLWEISVTAKRLVEAYAKRLIDPELIDEKVFKFYSLMGSIPDPDLVIRSGGELRISNFLLPHIAYSELYFIKKPWPSVDELDIAIALRDYSRRERRFGY